MGAVGDPFIAAEMVKLANNNCWVDILRSCAQRGLIGLVVGSVNFYVRG